MKYDHVVKRNGKYYAAGEEVPDKNDTPQNTPVNDDSAKELPFSDVDIEMETSPIKRGRPKKSTE